MKGQLLFTAAAIVLAGCGQKTPLASKEAPRLPVIKFFYGNAANIPLGESLTLCYGTENVDKLTMEPYDEGALSPSFNRCVAHTPKRDTTYVLKAAGPGGETSSTFSVRVGPAAPRAKVLITSFNSVGNVPVKRGEGIQLCYSTEGASSVSITPRLDAETKPGKNHCVETSPAKTTTYLLTATAADGATDRMQVTVPVQ